MELSLHTLLDRLEERKSVSQPLGGHTVINYTRCDNGRGHIKLCIQTTNKQLSLSHMEWSTFASVASAKVAIHAATEVGSSQVYADSVRITVILSTLTLIDI